MSTYNGTSPFPVSGQTGQPTVHRIGGVLVILLFMLLFALAVVVWTRASQNRFPGENSPEAGFARDMMVHHSQAVNMAQLLYDRTQNSELRIIALDIMLSQQTQIGQMTGWLDIWGLPVASAALPMTWMDMPTRGLMEGMATDDQLAALRAAKGVDADRLFIQLMIPHHQSAIHMAKAVLERSKEPVVVDLAQAVIDTQQREIDELTRIGTAIGAKFSR
jgi:uncharacterized protein (DUF305 family)